MYSEHLDRFKVHKLGEIEEETIKTEQKQSMPIFDKLNEKENNDEGFKFIY